jgi:hypothetical protein
MKSFTLTRHSGAPRSGEPGIHNPGAAEYGFRLSLTEFTIGPRCARTRWLARPE